MWIEFNIDGMLFNLKIDDYNVSNEYVNISFEYKFKDIINYKKYSQKILLSKDIYNIKDIIRKLLNNELKNDEVYQCFEPDFSFEFLNSKWLKIDTYLWSNEDKTNQITNNMISITLGIKEIEQLYNYLKLIMNEININDSVIKEMINNNIIKQ